MHSKNYFIANWKMNGDAKDLQNISKVEKYLKMKKNIEELECVFCLPFTLLGFAKSHFKNSQIKFGSQDLSCKTADYGAFTGSISAQMIKNLGCKYTILGHSEVRSEGDTDKLIDKKIRFAIQKKLKVILCVGESLKEFKNKKSFGKVKRQIYLALNNNRKSLNNITIAYEPIWSIGTGIVPNDDYLKNFFIKINDFVKKKFKKKIPILYGGSVSHKNISNFKKIDLCKGFLIGGASLKSKNFIDIIKNYYN